MKRITKTKKYSSLISDLAVLIEQGRKAAVRQFYLIYGDIEKRYTLCSESYEFKGAKIET